MNPTVKNILEWVCYLLIAIILALLVRYFIGTPTVVQQPSMDPTLKEGQRLILNRLIRTFKEMPQRGDIITFEAPSESYIPVAKADRENPVAIYHNKDRGLFGNFTYHILEFTKKSYIKRVIALPGEHVQIYNGNVYIDGKLLKEDYLRPNVTTDGKTFSDFVVPKDTVFVMGDNRTHSTDSREFGCIPKERIESKVWIRFWPFDAWGSV